MQACARCRTLLCRQVFLCHTLTPHVYAHIYTHVRTHAHAYACTHLYTRLETCLITCPHKCPTTQPSSVGECAGDLAEAKRRLLASIVDEGEAWDNIPRSEPLGFNSVPFTCPFCCEEVTHIYAYTHTHARTHARMHAHVYTHAYTQIYSHTYAHVLTHVCTYIYTHVSPRQVGPKQALFLLRHILGHNYIGHSTIGHNYIGRNCIGHNTISHNYIGHNYILGRWGPRKRCSCSNAATSDGCPLELILFLECRADTMFRLWSGMPYIERYVQRPSVCQVVCRGMQHVKYLYRITHRIEGSPNMGFVGKSANTTRGLF